MSESVVNVSNPSIPLEKLKLPTISQQGLKALEIINAKDLQFRELETVLSSDPMLMGILIKYANSPMYRKHVETTNIRQAINLLGLNIVKSAILICTLRSFCEPVNPAKEMLWGKSMSLSIMAKLIGSNISRKLSDEIELTAMMSEMGGFVLSTNFGNDYEQVVERAKQKKIALEDEEFYSFGLNRAEITALTLNKLRLPQKTMDILDNYYNKNIPIEIKSDVDRQLIIIKLASILIAYKSKVELIKKDSLCTSLFDLLGLKDINIEELITSYENEISEGILI